MVVKLKLKRMPNISGRLHYQCLSRKDHLYIKEEDVKREMPDEFEIPFSQWNDYFAVIACDEQTEKDFIASEEVSKDFAKINARNKEIESNLLKHAEKCFQFKQFMEHAYKSFTIKDGWTSLKPLIRRFTGCPFCLNEFF